jgi:hypothetical protein
MSETDPKDPSTGATPAPATTPKPKPDASAATGKGAATADKSKSAASPGRARTGALWAVCALLLVLVLIAGGLAVLALRPELRAGLPGPLAPPAPDSRLAGRLSALEARVDGLGGSVADLARKAAAPAPSPAPETTPEAAAPPAANAALDDLTARNAALEQRLDALNATLQAVRGEAEGQSHDLTDQVHQIKTRIDQLAADQEKAAQATQHVAVALTLGNLEAALLTGRPYAAQVAAMRRLGVKDADMPTLVARADAGVPSEPELAAQFPALADRAVRAERQANAGNWFARLWARLRTLVIARPVGDVAGDGTPEILARAQVRLDSGDLTGAVAEVGTLKGAAAATLKEWTAGARARLSVEAELSHLRDRLVGDLAGRG